MSSCSRSRGSRTNVLGRRHLTVLLAVLIRKLTPKRLPDEGLRQRLTELDVLGDLERGQLSAAMRDDVLRGRLHSRPYDHEGLHLFALDRMRHADRGAVEHGRMRR